MGFFIQSTAAPSRTRVRLSTHPRPSFRTSHNAESPKNAVPQFFTVESGHRFYSPELGRWLSRDPIGERGGVNVFAFSLNTGINRLDILGLYLENNVPIGIGLGSPDMSAGEGADIDWQAVLEEVILSRAAIEAHVQGGFTIPIGTGVLNISATGEFRAFRCLDVQNQERRMFEVMIEVAVEGGIGFGLGIKRYSEPPGLERNKLGDFGKKLKDLAAQPLPWRKQGYVSGGGGAERWSEADGGCLCPKAGWEGAVQVGVFAKAGVGMTGRLDAYLEWKFGTPFNYENVDAKLQGQFGWSGEITAQVGIRGAANATWNRYIDRL